MAIDGRVVDTAEKMVRRIYNLKDSYLVKSCNVKSSTVELVMHNGLISLKCVVPKYLVDDSIERGLVDDEGNPVDEDFPMDEETPDDEEEDETPEPEVTNTVRKVPIKK